MPKQYAMSLTTLGGLTVLSICNLKSLANIFIAASLSPSSVLILLLVVPKSKSKGVVALVLACYSGCVNEFPYFKGSCYYICSLFLFFCFFTA